MPGYSRLSNILDLVLAFCLIYWQRRCHLRRHLSCSWESVFVARRMLGTDTRAEHLWASPSTSCLCNTGQTMISIRVVRPGACMMVVPFSLWVVAIYFFFV